MTDSATATRHLCMNRSHPGAGLWHTGGPGNPTPQRCAGCGGALLVQHGWYGVFVHSSYPGAGPSGPAYARADAVSLHTCEGAAGRVVDADTTGMLVIRGVNAEVDGQVSTSHGV